MLRVLVVEDDQDTAESLRSLLALRGYLVVVARTSQQGIEAARRHEPQIVRFDEHLVKPVDPTTLLQHMQRTH